MLTFAMFKAIWAKFFRQTENARIFRSHLIKMALKRASNVNPLQQMNECTETKYIAFIMCVAFVFIGRKVIDSLFFAKLRSFSD